MTADSVFPAAILFAVAAWSFFLVRRCKPSVRLNLRFAAMVLAALAAAAPLTRIGDVAALAVLPLACAALALAALARFAQRAPPLAASLALAGALALGLGAAFTGSPLLAAFPAALAALLIAGAALQDFAWVAALGGMALLAAVSAFLREGAGPGLLLFAAAALLGLSRQERFQEKRVALVRRRYQLRPKPRPAK